MKAKTKATGTSTIKTLQVKAYVTPDGTPTCAIDFEKGDVCQFYRTTGFGCRETCVFAQSNGHCFQTLKRRNGGEGFLVPLDCCPIWKTQ